MFLIRLQSYIFYYVFILSQRACHPVTSAKLYDPAGTKSKYAAAKGWNMFVSIEETEYSVLPGDADGSGDVNAADIDVISKCIMEGNTNGFVFKNADVNGDKKINVADIVEIVKIIKANK